MSDLDVAVAKTTGEHTAALNWFRDNTGRTVTWSEIQAQAELRTRLVTQAKGIYKPHYMEYALSVRQTLDSPYADKEIQRRPDGSWVYPYFQENPDPRQRDREATNRGLVKCMNDGIPIGVLIQTRPKPGVEYEVLGLGKVLEWKDGYFILEGFSREGVIHRADAARDRAEAETLSQSFDSPSASDQRQKAMAEVVRRRGQVKFRRALLEAYGDKCAISGCDAVEALEACHIAPYRGDYSDHIQNGLLLRADLHSLLDLGLIAIEPGTMTVRIAAQLEGTTYSVLAGTPLLLPSDPSKRPSIQALAEHFTWSGIVASRG
ncbi:HNH endonuclease [Rhizobium cauense]|uniref:HNH endonuclease n=1 Tax=Rhizobium cauense TaxID=1166683 RepID=UPI001C6DEAD4|nr:HNH endonuclease signature motif containing protein [Rhizobium cauense]MBW9117181.1 HNH endonuclease [Rhizobium cauense]